MTLRKGKDKLQKPCKKCGEYYLPTGKATKYCDKCSKIGTFIKRLKRLQMKNDMPKSRL